MANMLVQKSHPSSVVEVPNEDWMQKHDRALAQLAQARKGWQLARDSFDQLQASIAIKSEAIAKEIEKLKNELEDTKLGERPKRLRRESEGPRLESLLRGRVDHHP